MNAATCHALQAFLSEQIESEEAINWTEADMDDDLRAQLISEKEINLLRLNQLMDLVHAAYQEAT